jgi:hypothetical protein
MSMSPATGRYASPRGHGEPRQSTAHHASMRARKAALTRRERAAHAPRYAGAPRPLEPKPHRAGATLRGGATPRRDKGRALREPRPHAWPQAGTRARGPGHATATR